MRCPSERFDRHHAGCRELFPLHVGRRMRRLGSRARCLFHVGGVPAAFAKNHFVLPSRGGHHKLVRKLPAHSAGISFHGDRFQPGPLKSTSVGVVHFPVAFLGQVIGRIKAVGIFHDEFLGPHQAEPRADFIAKLDLDLVKILGQLPVGVDFAGHQRGDDFFVCRSQHPFLLGPVTHLEQHVLQRLVPAGLVPDFRRLQCWHQQFQSTGAIHFFAHDLLHLPQGPQAQRQKRVETAGQLADQPGAQQQFMRDNFRIGRRFF